MREEASFHMFIEKDAQTEFVSKAEEYYSQFFLSNNSYGH